MNKWDDRFLNMAQLVALWSKDPSSKIGSVVVNDEHRVLSMGYNGFPKSMKDDEELYADREYKYRHIVHAEANAIYNATASGQSLRDSTVYVYGLMTCSECAKALIQVGVKRVVMKTFPVIRGNPEKWKESWSVTKKMFHEANIDWEIVE